MKKRRAKSLKLCKKTISSLEFTENIKGGNRSHTSCLCMDTMCECELKTPLD